MNQLRRFRDAAVAVVLLVLPFFFLSANLKDPDEVGLVDAGLTVVEECIGCRRASIAPAWQRLSPA